MTRASSRTILSVFSAVALWAQAPTATFEVATIKPASEDNIRVVAGGNGQRMMVRTGLTGDKGRINYINVSLKDVLARAYGVKQFQVNVPSWFESDRYDIVAKIPEGADQDKVPEMLRGLLIERCKMTVHKETKEHPIYALIVGKNGPKLKPAEESDTPMVFTAPDGSKINLPAPGPGGAAFAGAGRGAMMMMDSTGRMQIRGATMPSFADSLSRFLDRPVLDMTGIEGKYDLSLEMSPEDMAGMKKMTAGMGAGAMVKMGGGDGHGEGPAPDSAPRGSLFSSVQQLGLKLDSRKAPVEFVIVDKAEKPSEN